MRTLDEKRNPAALDLAEVFARAVRHALRGASTREISLAFDFRGERAWVLGDEHAISCGLHRVLCAAVDLLPERLLLVDGETRPGAAGRLSARIRIGGSGALPRDAAIDEFLARLRLKEAGCESGMDRPRFRRVYGRCLSTGGQVGFDYSPSAGFFIQLGLSFDVDETRNPVPLLNAHHARAWVVDSDPLTGGSLERRLQRSGWATTGFESLSHAMRRLRAMPALHARPALVVAVESANTSARDLLGLSELLPNRSGCVLLTRPGSESLASVDRLAVAQVRAMPLSPGEINGLTAEFSAAAQGPSGFTRPAPLLERDRPTLLVVDDDEVNRVIAGNMAETLGCRFQVACDGAQAVEACRLNPPELVLMDVSMPVMNGIEATLRLRDLQRNGDIAPFAVVAMTTEASASMRQRCLKAGMDGFLSKPLLRSELLGELRRLAVAQPPLGPD